MKGILEMINDMEKEEKNILMGLFMKDNLITEKNMETEKLAGQMELDIKGSLWIIFSMEEESMSMLMEGVILEIGKEGKCMGLGLIVGLVEKSILEAM